VSVTAAGNSRVPVAFRSAQLDRLLCRLCFGRCEERCSLLSFHILALTMISLYMLGGLFCTRIVWFWTRSVSSALVDLSSSSLRRRFIERFVRCAVNLPELSTSKSASERVSLVTRFLRRARDSDASFANNAALWLSVSLMMFLRKRVFGLGLFAGALRRKLAESKRSLVTISTLKAEMLHP